MSDLLTKDLTPAQQKQFETLSKGNDTMGAQKMILAELKSEFGGQAEAQATAGEKMKVAFDNMKESVGTALLPALDKGMSAATAFFGVITTHLPAVAAIIASFVVYQGVVTAVGAAQAVAAAGGVRAWIAQTRIATAVQWAMNPSLLANPITWVVVLIAGLVAAIVVLWKKNETFRKVVLQVWAAIKTAVKVVAD